MQANEHGAGSSACVPRPLSDSFSDSGSGDDFDMRAWRVVLETGDALEEGVRSEEKFRKEFEEVWLEWVRYAGSIDWKIEFSH